MQLNTYIDHTLLSATSTEKEIKSLCLEAIKYNFKSVCINPCYVKLASKTLKGTNVSVCTVIGFPLGQNKTNIKTTEAKTAIKDGATELDLVINVGYVKANKYKYVEKEISSIKSLCDKYEGNIILKVIIEICYLTNDEIIKLCNICADLGVDFVKTSTGYGQSGANVDIVKLMVDTLKGRAQVKASGGIKTKEDALKMIQAGATRLGTSNSVKIMQGDE